VILHGDCLNVLKTLDAESIDACVTDPPYGIGFMGKEWDTFDHVKAEERLARSKAQREKNRAFYEDNPNPNLRRRQRSPALSSSAIEYDYSVKGLREFQAWCELWAREVYRVLKPGAHIVVCGAPRAYHRMASGLEDAGFEIRDCLAWLFGSGFPKSLNLGEGLGTALKPAHEPIVLARKPFKGTVKGNVEKFGTGALNIDACRIPHDGDSLAGGSSLIGKRTDTQSEGWTRPWMGNPDAREAARQRSAAQVEKGEEIGRWPANVVIDDLAAMVIDEQSGQTEEQARVLQRNGARQQEGWGLGAPSTGLVHGDAGGASRFYYCAKPSREERDMGCHGLSARTAGECTDRKDGSAGLNNPRAGAGRTGGGRNFHPTVKPIELMRWLIRLVTPIGGTVLDPFLGSGTTGMAARYELRGFIGIEREAYYIQIAERRIASVAPLFAEATR